MKLAIFQPDASPGSPARQLERLDAALDGREGLDLIVCPELFLSGYGDPEQIRRCAEARDGPSSVLAAAIARKHNLALVYGYPEADGDKRYNAALYVSKSGEQRTNHRKRVLPTAYEEGLFSKGAGATIITLDNGLQAGLLICYEAEIPEAVRALAVAGVELVIAPTALGVEWRVVSRQVMRARAFENGVFLAYANHAGRDGLVDYIGDSVIVSPMGEDLARAGAVETLITAEIEPSILPAIRRRLPYLRDYKSLV